MAAEFFVSPQFFLGFGLLVVGTLVAGFIETYQAWYNRRRK